MRIGAPLAWLCRMRLLLFLGLRLVSFLPSRDANFDAVKGFHQLGFDAENLGLNAFVIFDDGLAVFGVFKVGNIFANLLAVMRE